MINPKSSATNVSLPANVLLQGFEELLKKISLLRTPEDLYTEITPLFLLTPFLRVIQSGDTTGPITGAALSSIQTFLLHDIIHGKKKELIQVCSLLIHTVTHAKFEATDAPSDEAVLWRILSLVHEVLRSKLATYLMDEAVCELIEMGMSMWMMHRLHETVRRLSEQVLQCTVRLVFSSHQGAFTNKCQMEILRVIAAILSSSQSPSSESLMLIALSLLQNILHVSHDQNVLGIIRSSLMLTLLGIVEDQDEVLDNSIGVGIQAPASQFPSSRPTVNVLTLTWQTLQLIWTLDWREMSNQYALILDFVLEQPPSERWEVREARLLLLRQMGRTPEFWFALFNCFDCHPDRENLFHRFVDHHVKMIENPKLSFFALDFIQRFLAVLLNSPSFINSELRETKTRKSLVDKAISVFKVSLRQGVDFLLQNKLVPDNTPESLSNFFYFTAGMDKKVVGEYIGKPSNIEILHLFMKYFDFSGMRIDEALRRMMLKLRLPGEAQMIDRVLESFSKQFFAQNPNQEEIENPDAGFILAFSIIMLNTDQHNPQVRNRMNCESFCRNLRGLNNKRDFPQAYLENIFQNIHENEIKDSTSLEQRFSDCVSNPAISLAPSQTSPPDSEAILRDVYECILEGLLSSKEPLALSCLSLLSRQHNCSEEIIIKLAKINNLSPIKAIVPPSPTANSGPSTPGNKLTLNHTHLVLFFAILYHLNSSLSDSTRLVTMEAMSTLFIYDLLPNDIMKYYDPLRSREARIPLNVEPVNPAPSTSRAASPQTQQARASTSLFSFISYLSTSFNTNEQENGENALLKDILKECHIEVVMQTAPKIEALIDMCKKYPPMAPFYLEWIYRILDHGNQTESLSLYLSHLSRYFTASAPHCVAIVLRLCATFPEIANNEGLVSQISVPASPEVLLSLAPEHFNLFLPRLKSEQYFEMLCKAKGLDQFAKVLDAHSLLPHPHGESPLPADNYKTIVMLMYRNIMRSQNSSHVFIVIKAALKLHDHLCRNETFIEYIKVFAILMFHSLPELRILAPLEQALFKPLSDLTFVPILFKNVLIPLLQQLVLEAKRPDDQAKVSVLLVKFYVHFAPAMERGTLKQIWNDILVVLVEYLTTHDHLVLKISIYHVANINTYL
jgi:hypothetical protein